MANEIKVIHICHIAGTIANILAVDYVHHRHPYNLDVGSQRAMIYIPYVIFKLL